MKKKIQNLLSAVLMVPLLALGASALVPATEVGAAPASDPANCDPSDGTIGSGALCAAPPSQQNNGSLMAIFQTVANILLFLIGAIAVIMLIIGGIRYVISGGDQGQVTAAKNTILYAIIGIVVAFLAFAAVNFVIGQLNG